MSIFFYFSVVLALIASTLCNKTEILKFDVTCTLTVLFREKGPQRRKMLKSAIQEIINSVSKHSCSPKQEDKECSLCLKFNTVVEAQ